jgi:hypothetical protein
MRFGRNTPFFQRTYLGLGLALVLALAGCGGAGSKYQEFLPSRIVVIGDEISYIGCSQASAGAPCVATDANDRFTINNSDDNTLATNTNDVNSLKLGRYNNNWILRLAANYGLPLSSIVETTYQKDLSTSRRNSRLGAKLAEITAQTLAIPPYQRGDMLIIAGGANDILDTLVNPPSSPVVVNAIMAPYRTSFLSQLPAPGVAGLSDNQINQILNAAQGYQNLAKSMLNAGQRNVFMPTVYDFSNSPDLNTFCSGCQPANVKAAINLFDTALKLDLTGQLVAGPGEPRVLITSGYSAGDALYVNITTPTTGNLVGYTLISSVCGASTTANRALGDTNNYDVPVDQCVWNGLYSDYTVTSGATSITYHPTTTLFPAFLTSSPQGAFVYARDFYLTPNVHNQIGNIFYTFMRGFQGW